MFKDYKSLPYVLYINVNFIVSICHAARHLAVRCEVSVWECAWECTLNDRIAQQIDGCRSTVVIRPGGCEVQYFSAVTCTSLWLFYGCYELLSLKHGINLHPSTNVMADCSDTQINKSFVKWARLLWITHIKWLWCYRKQFSQWQHNLIQCAFDVSR